MAKILITSGPTRQFLDPVRYLTNSSSGQMGVALAQAALRAGHEVTIVTGPVHVDYPKEAEIIPVTTTDEMLQASQEAFEKCDGVIGAAAPCDYQPMKVSDTKLSKTGAPLVMHLVETPDVIATLGAGKRADQWAVGFALETDDIRFKALTKLEKKCCDLIVLNGPEAINSPRNSIEIIDREGETTACCSGTKQEVAEEILAVINARLIRSEQTS